MINNFHFAVVGENISYSKSADIFKAALRQLKHEATCDILSVSSDQIENILEKIRNGFYLGASITIPYKSMVIEKLDHAGQSASELKAVNSICLTDNKLTGFNTDIDGFAYPFKSRSDLQTPETSLVLGYGGAAKAVVFSLANLLGCKRIVLAGRSLEKLLAFQENMSGLVGDCELIIKQSESNKPAQIDLYDLVVNCTPLGGWNAPDKSPIPAWFDWSMTRVYYDLNYNENNLLIIEASQAGLKAVDGSIMLVAQALKSLQLWTALEIPFGPVYNSVFPRS